MKKLLVLALVLGLAGAANAGLVEVDATKINPGETATFSVVSPEGEGNWAGWLEISTTGTGDLGPLTLTAKAPVGEADTFVKGEAELGYGGWYQFSIVSTNPGNQPVPGVQATMTFSGAEGDTGTVTLWDATGAVAIQDPVTVEVIPEPMTLGLLGLGGLFLRRRK